jgi:ADP-ribosyl-[dinitrogen reductase] hydrolase
MNLNDRLKGCLWGSFVGDALGAPYEFKKRGTFRTSDKYISGGKFNLKPGEWTDDTSMSLCAMASIIDHKGQLNYHDMMIKWLKWYKTGYMSSKNMCFDIGQTTCRSLMLYESTKTLFGGPSHERFSGNGGIMRYAPIAIYCRHFSLLNAIKCGKEYSNLTHPSNKCQQCAGLLMYFLYQCFNVPNITKEELVKPILFADSNTKIYQYSPDQIFSEQTKKIVHNAIHKKYDDIKSSGYVVYSMEVALFAFFHSTNFIDGLLMVINMGGDTDTIGAIYGQIAGAYYGYSSINRYYIEHLHNQQMLSSLIENFLKVTDCSLEN